MKIWKNIRKFLDGRFGFYAVYTVFALILFLFMKSEYIYTDAFFCIITAAVVARSHKRHKENMNLLKQYVLLENYIETVRYELLENKSRIFMTEYLGMELSLETEMSKHYYYRVFNCFIEVYDALGNENINDVTDTLSAFSSGIVREHDIRIKLSKELSGLRFIILSAVFSMPLTKRWVTANMSSMELYYESIMGNIVRYGIWCFALIIYMLVDRLEEIK